VPVGTTASDLIPDALRGAVLGSQGPVCSRRASAARLAALGRSRGRSSYACHSNQPLMRSVVPGEVSSKLANPFGDPPHFDPKDGGG